MMLNAIGRSALYYLALLLLRRFREQPGLRGLIVVPLLARNETPLEQTSLKHESIGNTLSPEILLPFSLTSRGLIHQRLSCRQSSGFYDSCGNLLFAPPNHIRIMPDVEPNPGRPQNGQASDRGSCGTGHGLGVG